MLKLCEKFVSALTVRTAQVAQIALFFAMFIIVANVITRIWGKPVPGSVELVEMSGAVLLGMAVAYTALMKGHIMVGVLVERFSPRAQAVVDLFTSAIALIFIYFLSRETFFFGIRMAERGYTTGSLRLPMAPSIYLVGFGFAMLALVLLMDTVKSAIMVTKGSETK